MLKFWLVLDVEVWYWLQLHPTYAVGYISQCFAKGGIVYAYAFGLPDCSRKAMPLPTHNTAVV